MIDYRKYINALRKCAKEHNNDKTPTFNIIVSDLCRDTANLLEKVEQETKWISVKDMLPEDNDRYLCTYKFGNAYGIVIRRFINGGWYASVGDYVKGIQEYDIVAWQPLPKPYKAESEEK